MKFKTIENSCSWVRFAIENGLELDNGSFSTVFDYGQDGLVVKLTNSTAAFESLMELSGQSDHFLLVKEARPEQAVVGNVMYHALLLEKVAPADFRKIRTLTDFLYKRKSDIGNDYLTLLQVAGLIRARDEQFLNYPISLAEAFCKLAAVWSDRCWSSDLYTEANYGQRTDGTLVLLDPAHAHHEFD